MGPQHNPRRPAFVLLRGTTFERLTGRRSNSQRYAGPCRDARGVRPWSDLFSVPPMRGDGAPKGAVSGFRGTARGAAGLWRIRRMRPRLPTRHSRYLSAFAFLGGRTMRGQYYALLPTSARGRVTKPARQYRIRFPSCGVPQRTPIVWDEMILAVGEIHPHGTPRMFCY